MNSRREIGAAVADIAVIGGGPAGMMAAIAAKQASPDLSVAIFEKMPRPGRKILVTGKGRCNLTNACGWEEFSTHVHPKPGLLKHPFSAFPPERTVEAFNAMGLECVTERGRRVFPASMKAMDVVDSLVSTLHALGVDIRCGCKVTGLGTTPEGTFTIECCETDSAKANASRQDRKLRFARSVILATGGLSYPLTGSEGDGYPFAASFGHKIVRCFPSLTALRPAGYGSSRKMLEGIHLKNVSLTLFVDGSPVQEEFGELDFTDGGIEGALGFRVSRKAVKALISGSSVMVRIDLKPALDETRLASERTSAVAGGLEKLLPSSIARAFSATNKANIKRYGPAASLKKWDFAIDGYTGYERAVITAGGVAADAINPKTMESKLVQGLYFAGEILDLDGDTGGYNLQIAWSTGHAAGKAAGMAAGSIAGSATGLSEGQCRADN